jgi:glycerol-3-phosphate dehydrogenase
MDVAVSQLGVKTKKCQTHITPVNGGKIDDFRAFLRQAITKVPGVIKEGSTEHLVYTYGSEYQKLAECMLRQPDLARQIDPSLPVTAAQVEHAVQHEMALTLGDVIARRTELGATGLPSIITLQKCAGLIAHEFQWSLERQHQEIDRVLQGYPFRQTEVLTA